MRKVVYKNYLLILLMVILTFNYVDRCALGIVLQDIKIDLDVTDTQLGFLTGIAFALFYSVMGIPIARWADRGNRVTVITLTTGLWSVAVGLCGLATGFLQLMLFRVGVAVGEAGCIPPAHSLIADYFSRAERPRALSIYMLGVPLSLMIGFLSAGWLNELYGWRVAFFVLGMPGLVLAVVARLTLREPRSSKQTMIGCSPKTAQPSFKEVCKTLWANAAFRHLLICFSVWYFFGYGLLQWQPAFFIRSHGLQTGELGTWFALVHGVGCGVGTWLGGEWAARYAAGDERMQLSVCALAFAFFAVLSACTYLAPNHYWGFLALALANVGGSMALGPLLATIQTLVPSSMRAMSVALVYLFANLIGMGLGPVATGALSDALRPMFGNESLRYALVILSPGYFWAAWHAWLAGRTVIQDLRAAQLRDEPDPALTRMAAAPE